MTNVNSHSPRSALKWWAKMPMLRDEGETIIYRTIHTCIYCHVSMKRLQEARDQHEIVIRQREDGRIEDVEQRTV